MAGGIIGIIAANYKDPQYRQSSARSVDIAGRARGAGRNGKVEDSEQKRADNFKVISPLIVLCALFVSDISMTIQLGCRYQHHI